MDKSFLTPLGLSTGCSTLYLAALQLGTASVSALAKKAGLKRPTAYSYLEELLVAGLIEKIPLGKRHYYRAKDPQTIEMRAEAKLQSIRSVIPELIAMQQEAEGRPRISIAEGKEAIEALYQEISENAWSLRVWSNPEIISEHFHGSSRELAKAARRRGIHIKEIVRNTADAKRAIKMYQSISGPTHELRVATKKGLENDNMIFGNTAVLFRIHAQNFYLVRIEDPTIVQSLKVLFDMAWGNAKKFTMPK